MDAVCKAYHRAVRIPLDNVERLWQELEAFETGLNNVTVRPSMSTLHISDRSAGENNHGGSPVRPYANPNRPLPTPKASRSTFPTTSTIDARQTSPVLTVVTHFQPPGESASRSMEILPGMGGKQPPGSRREGSHDVGQQNSARLPESSHSYEILWRDLVCVSPFPS